MESVKKKGQTYVQKIPTQRFLKVLLQFDCAIVLFGIYRYLTGNRYGVKKILLTLVGWDGIGNSNWYIFCILWLYIFTFFAFKVFGDMYEKSIMGVFIWSILYMLIMHRLGKAQWWYDTVLCFTWGMLFSLYRDKVEKLIRCSKNSWHFFFLTSIVGYVATYLYRNDNCVVYQMWVFCFVVIIVTFTMQYVIVSSPLQWLGENLFELYILQRLPMIILKDYIFFGRVESIVNYVYVVVCFIITLILAVIYKKTINKMIKKLLERH